MDAGADASKEDQRGRVHVFVLHGLVLFAVEGPSDSDHIYVWIYKSQATLLSAGNTALSIADVNQDDDMWQILGGAFEEVNGADV